MLPFLSVGVIFIDERNFIEDWKKLSLTSEKDNFIFNIDVSFINYTLIYLKTKWQIREIISDVSYKDFKASLHFFNVGYLVSMPKKSKPAFVLEKDPTQEW